ncbi:MAG: phage antirepressor KilAC domain-containing protein [Lachnospiraceae bacterium]|nr:phage antirepressor KilAC domain-containing protein [Lachnospiraceae bacterium]
MNDLTVFENEEFGKVRTTVINDEPYFVGNDVADILGYKEPRKAVKNLVDNDDGIKYPVIDSLGRTQETIVINESGLYSLILSSKLKQAKAFKRWVTSEVLPSIRKHGGYVTGQEQMTDEELMAKAILMANSKIKELDSKNKQLQAVNSQLVVTNEIMKPKAEYFDDLVDRNLLTNFRDTAKALQVKEKLFVKFLIDHKYVYRDGRGKSQPYADKNKDLFEVKETKNEKTAWVGTQTLITPKGRETFRLLFIN